MGHPRRLVLFLAPEIELISSSAQFDVINGWSATVGFTPPLLDELQAQRSLACGAFRISLLHLSATAFNRGVSDKTGARRLTERHDEFGELAIP